MVKWTKKIKKSKDKDMSRKWEKGQHCAGFRWTVSGRAQTGRNSQWEGRLIMISCYTPEQPSSYSLVDVTESLPLSPSVSLCLTLDSCRDHKPSCKLQRKRSISRSLLMTYETFVFFKFLLQAALLCFKRPLSFLTSVASQFSLHTVIIHHWGCLTFSFPWNQLQITPIKDGDWRRRRRRRGRGFWMQFQTPLGFLLLRKESLRKAGGMFTFPPPPLNDKRKCYPDMMGISKMAVQRSESMQRQIALPYAGLVKTSIMTSVRGWHPVRIFQKASTLDYSWKKAPVIFILLQSRTQIQYWYTDSFSFWKFKFSALPQWLTSTATSLLSPSLTHNPIGSYFCPTRNSCNFMFAISRGADGPEKRNKFFFRQSRSFATQWDSGGRTEGRW